jgi:hypothetical protein
VSRNDYDEECGITQRDITFQSHEEARARLVSLS